MKINKYLFEMETKKYGKIRATHLTLGAITVITKRLPDYKVRPSRDITVASASALCFADEDKSIDGSHLTDAELIEFAKKFLDSRPRFSINDKPVDVLPRNEKEDLVDYCGRVIATEINRFHDQMVNVVEKSGVISAFKKLNTLSDMFKQSASLSALSGLKNATDSIRSAMQDVERFSLLNSTTMQAIHDIEKQNKRMREAVAEPLVASIQVKPYFERMEIPMPPPNPIHKTNKKLEDLTEQVTTFTNELTEHLSASAIALKEVAEQLESGSKRTSKQNNIMIGLTVLSLLMALLTVYFGSGRSVSERSTPPRAVVEPVEVKSRPAPAVKTTPETKPQHSVSNNKHSKEHVK